MNWQEARANSVITLACLLCLFAGEAKAMTVGEWQGYSEEYKLGFVTGIVDEAMSVQHAGPNGAKMVVGFRNCLNGQLPSTVLKVVNSYLDRHPSAYTESPASVVVSAMLEMCDAHLHRALK
jgi:hypothetical protein